MADRKNPERHFEYDVTFHDQGVIQAEVDGLKIQTEFFWKDEEAEKNRTTMLPGHMFFASIAL